MIKTAIIGFGLSGKVFHAPLVNANSDFNLVHIVSSRHQEIKTSYPNVQTSLSYEEVLKSNVDLIIITTPNTLHYKQAKQALLAGKNVIVEKPFVVESGQGIELQKLASDKNLLLSVYHNRR